jgi:hypothetical protein
MDSILGYIEIEHGAVASVCRIILDRDVNQPINHGFAGDGIRGPVAVAEKLCDGYDISLLIGNIFGSEVLDTAQVKKGGEVLRGQWASRSHDNSLTTVDFKVGETGLKVEFETRAMFSREDWDLPLADTRGRRAIIITARKDIITRMTDHFEFRDICDCLVSDPAEKYQPKLCEIAVDLGRAVFQPLAGSLIGDINGQGDVIVFMRGVFGEKVSGSFEMATEVARRSREETIGRSVEYHGIKIGELRAPVEFQSSRISICNYVRELTFKVEGGRIAARFETAKGKDSDSLAADEAIARRIMRFRGPKHLMGIISGHSGMEALCHELSARDIAQISSGLVLTGAIASGGIPRAQPGRRDYPMQPRMGGRPPSQYDDHGGFMRPPRRMRNEPPKPQPKPPANAVEGVARLTMKQVRPGYDRLGRRTR